jgi:hypothetical protein
MWAEIKEVFFTIGSLAGVAALARSVLEDKLQRDHNRIQHVKDLISEQDLLNLEYTVWYNRWAQDSTFSKLNQIEYEIEKKHDSLRFNGPTAKYLATAVRDIAEHYRELREYVQVPEWEPQDRDGDTVWFFNKQAFFNDQGIPENYADHLKKVADAAHAITLAYQRFQIVADLHLLEAPFARWLLAKRIREHGSGNGA